MSAAIITPAASISSHVDGSGTDATVVTLI
jgi:hypothetical protein